MNKLNVFFMAFISFTMVASATSLHPDTFRNDVSPVLTKVDITHVAKKGEVVKRTNFRPFTNLLVSVPVSVNVGSACTKFVGQMNAQSSVGRLSMIQMMGTVDPINDICIAVMPEPVATNITIDFKVLTGGFVPADNIQSKMVQIHPLGLYKVTLDMANEDVTVVPVARHHR